MRGRPGTGGRRTTTDFSLGRPAAADGRGAAHEYVFEERGGESLDALVGTFLAPPQWVVRFVNWDAEAEERVEEFVVNVQLVALTLPPKMAPPPAESGADALFP